MEMAICAGSCCYDYQPLKYCFMERIAFYSLLCVLMVSFSSCAVVGGIFKAGVWVGVLMVVAVIGLIVFIAGRGSKK
jgi:hypothetical protein